MVCNALKVDKELKEDLVKKSLTTEGTFLLVYVAYSSLHSSLVLHFIFPICISLHYIYTSLYTNSCSSLTLTHLIL